MRAWLAAPVEHVRDIRSLFLLKVVSERARRRWIPSRSSVAQRAALVPFIGWLEAQVDDGGDDTPGETTAAVFRLETASAIMRFIDGMLDRSLAVSWPPVVLSRPAPDVERPGSGEALRRLRAARDADLGRCPEHRDTALPET